MAKHESGVGGILKLAVLVGGGYYLYKTYFESMLSSVADVSTSIANQTGGGPQGGNATISASQSTVAGSGSSMSPAQLQNAMDLLGAFATSTPGFFTHGTQGVATFDEWNYARGKYMSAPEGIEDVFPGMARDNLLTLDQYTAGLKAKGLAGGMGLGQILDFGFFYVNGPHRHEHKGNFR